MEELWKPVTTKTRTVVNTYGDGINVAVPGFEIKDNQLTYVRNMDSHEYPAITTRYDRNFFSTSLGTLASPNGIGERNNSQLHFLYGNNWGFWNSSSTAISLLSTSLSSTDGEIIDFVTGSARYTLMMNSTQLRYWDGTIGTTSLTLGDATTPYTKIVTVHKGRIFAAKGAILYYSALNLINDWTSASDAGSLTITRAKGDITSLCEYNDKVIAFTQFSMHELFGSGPDTFELIDVEGEIGCVSRRSVVKANKRLYWAWNDGIYEYNGGVPVKISQAVDAYFKTISEAYLGQISAGSRNDYIYFAIPYNGSATNNMILLYDTENRKWYVETGNFNDFVTIGNNVYGLDSTGGVLKMRDTNTGKDNGASIEWDMITKPYVVGSGQTAETLFDMNILYRGSTDATMNVYYSTESEDTSTAVFSSIATSSDFTLDGKDRVKRLTFPSTILQVEPYFRLRFSGTDDVTIYRTEINKRIRRR